jgi:hypothetical protein
MVSVSCRSIRNDRQILEPGYYRVRNGFQFHLSEGELKNNQKIYLEETSDTLYIGRSVDDSVFYRYQNVDNVLRLKKNSFDIDLFTIPLRIRFPAGNFPAQLNTNFNISLYTGFRRDYYKIVNERTFHNRFSRNISARGIGLGTFLGASQVTMNPFVTHGNIDYEYDGLALTYGISGIYAVQRFNAGIALGFDHLSDINRKYWIYQYRPWFGILLGLNLN